LKKMPFIILLMFSSLIYPLKSMSTDNFKQNAKQLSKSIKPISEYTTTPFLRNCYMNIPLPYEIKDVKYVNAKTISSNINLNQTYNNTNDYYMTIMFNTIKKTYYYKYDLKTNTYKAIVTTQPL